VHSGVAKSAFTFFASTTFSIIGSLFILIGASIWTVMIKKTQSINTAIIANTVPPVTAGIEVTIGTGLYMIWAAFVTLAVSVIPYMVRSVVRIVSVPVHRLIFF
jgi:hypothetical protein